MIVFRLIIVDSGMKNYDMTEPSPFKGRSVWVVN